MDEIKGKMTAGKEKKNEGEPIQKARMTQQKKK